MRKIAVSSLVIVLTSFSGGFCLASIPAQAMDMAGEQGMHESGDVVSGNDNSVTTLNLCVVNCASQPVQAVVTKKFSVDTGANLLADVVHYQTLHFSVSSSGPTDISGTHPPSPDILSSVFKKE